jgi:hypothetical protein
LKKDGKKESVSYEDYKRIQEMLEDDDDLRELSRAKEKSKGQKPIPFEKAVKFLKLEK